MSIHCPAVDGFYLRASGQFVCWNSPGEFHALATLAGEDLDGVDVVRDVLNGPEYRRMRRALHDHVEPFDFCESCSWGGEAPADAWDALDPGTFALRRIRTFQVEPSFLCNLDCPQCIPILERKRGAPPYSLDPRVFRKTVDDLARHGVEVGAVQYGGFGEPLMTPHFPELVRYAKENLGAPSACDSNGNFDFDERLLDCGLDWLVLAFDGVSQESYATYRRRGRLERLLSFARDAVEARERAGGSPLRLAWKTVLFEWNSSDEDLREACRLAGELGMDQVRFVNTTTPGGISARYQGQRWSEIRALVGELAAHSSIPIELDDPDCFAGEKHRCHGFVEVSEERDGRWCLSGWALLDDGPADEVLVGRASGAEVPAELTRREDLAGAHPTIPGAGGGGFRVEVPSLPDDAEDSELVFRLLRGGVERVRFALRRGPRALLPAALRHGKSIEV